MTAIAPETIADYASVVLLILGLFFFTVGVVGLLRLPDVFSRLHATTKSDTLGLGLILAAAIIEYGPGIHALQIGLLALFVAISTPSASHLIARAVFKSTAERSREEDLDRDR